MAGAGVGETAKREGRKREQRKIIAAVQWSSLRTKLSQVPNGSEDETLGKVPYQCWHLLAKD